MGVPWVMTKKSYLLLYLKKKNVNAASSIQGHTLTFTHFLDCIFSFNVESLRLKVLLPIKASLKLWVHPSLLLRVCLS